MKCVLFAYHEIGTRALQTLLQLGANVQALWTHRDDAQENIWFTPPATIAKQNGIPCFFPEDPNTQEVIEHLCALAPDVLFSFYYRKLLDQDILNIPRLGAFNLHGSLLPKYRGRVPIHWAIIRGEQETGITLHYMTKRADAGDIVAQRKIPISFTDTAHSLTAKMVDATEKLLREIYGKFVTEEIPRTPQNETAATKFGKRTPQDGLIHWHRSAMEIYNLLRAVTHPYPGAFSYLDGKKWFLWWGTPKGNETNLQPGRIRSESSSLSIETGKGLLQVERCQLEGEEELSALEFLQRHKLHNGDFLTK